MTTNDFDDDCALAGDPVRLAALDDSALDALGSRLTVQGDEAEAAGDFGLRNRCDDALAVLSAEAGRRTEAFIAGTRAEVDRLSAAQADPDDALANDPARLAVLDDDALIALGNRIQARFNGAAWADNDELQAKVGAAWDLCIAEVQQRGARSVDERIDDLVAVKRAQTERVSALRAAARRRGQTLRPTAGSFDAEDRMLSFLDDDLEGHETGAILEGDHEEAIAGEVARGRAELLEDAKRAAAYGEFLRTSPEDDPKGGT